MAEGGERGGRAGLRRGRLASTVPDRGEDFHSVAEVDGVRVEHIVSSATPDPAVQVQGWDEWVVLIAGAAELEVEGRPVALGAGDWILLPAGIAHRVVRTSHGARWLAVHGTAGSRDGLDGAP